MSRFSVVALWLVIFGLLWFAYTDLRDERAQWREEPPYVELKNVEVETLPPPVIRDATAAEEKALLEQTCLRTNLSNREHGISFTVVIPKGETCHTLFWGAKR